MIGILDIVDSIKQIDSILFPFIAKKKIRNAHLSNLESSNTFI